MKDGTFFQRPKRKSSLLIGLQHKHKKSLTDNIFVYNEDGIFIFSKAKEEIFITDWWLSPEIHLKRGIGYDDSFRLDTLLKKKSVSILVYVSI